MSPVAITSPIMSPVPREPVDLVLAIDLSASMNETDLAPDRLSATKKAVRQLLRASDGERFGIVILAQEVAVRNELTGDRIALDESIAELRIGDVPALGTAMGDGLALAVEQLKTSTAKRRFIIVLADGDTNVIARYSTSDAAMLAKTAGIVVHTVLVGHDGPNAFGVTTVNPLELKTIATVTGGMFHHANDIASFQNALKAILANARS
jgi:Ca-activated chloride channel homolog